jgi:hypothetical protein
MILRTEHHKGFIHDDRVGNVGALAMRENNKFPSPAAAQCVADSITDGIRAQCAAVQFLMENREREIARKPKLSVQVFAELWGVKRHTIDEVIRRAKIDNKHALYKIAIAEGKIAPSVSASRSVHANASERGFAKDNGTP